MRFLKDGPDIPERLLTAHEDGNVVFFCGAGISKPAGVPLFGELVERMARELYHDLDEIQETALDAGEYDRVVHLLERSLQGGRELVRSTLPRLLRPQRLDDDSLSAHRALLSLSRSGHGSGTLVTTNFDTLFEAATPDSVHITSLCPKGLKGCDGESARGTRATGDVELVYLHGRLPDAPAKNELDDDLDKELAQLILSSGDFGRAYLLESWASRYLSKLFTKHTVCFVGYSLNDPIVRYFTDALAIAEEAPTGGKNAPFELFAFEGCHQSDADRRALEWAAKGATLIPYDPDMGHIALRQTLSEWARCREVGEDWKSALVRNALKELDGTFDPESHLVEHVTYAIRDPSGRPMATFANWEPTPSLDWFEVVTGTALPATTASGNSYTHPMSRSDAPHASERYLSNSSRESQPLQRFLRDVAQMSSPLDRELMRWLVKHVLNANILLHLYEEIGTPHSELIDLLEQVLREPTPPQANAGIPLPRMKQLVELYASKRLKRREPLSQLPSLESLRGAAVSEAISERLQTFAELEVHNFKERTSISLNVVRPTRENLFLATELSTHPDWDAYRQSWLERLEQLLDSAVQLYEVISYQPAFRPFADGPPSLNEWRGTIHTNAVSEIVFLWRNLLSTLATERPDAAFELASRWVRLEGNPKQRLALYCLYKIAERGRKFHHELAHAQVEELLWNVYCEGDVLHLLVLLHRHSNEVQRQHLELAVMEGERDVSFKCLAADEQDYREWLRLANLAHFSGLALPRSRARLLELELLHPTYELGEYGLCSTHISQITGRQIKRPNSDQYGEAPLSKNECIEWLTRNADNQHLTHVWMRKLHFSRADALAALIDATLDESIALHRALWRKTILMLNERGEPQVYKDIVVCGLDLLEELHDYDFSRVMKYAHGLLQPSYSLVGDELVARKFQLAQRLHDLQLPQCRSADTSPQPHLAECAWSIAAITMVAAQREDDAGRSDALRILEEIATLPAEHFQETQVRIAAESPRLYGRDGTACTFGWLLDLFSWQAHETRARAAWDAIAAKAGAPLLTSRFLLDTRDDLLMRYQQPTHFGAQEMHDHANLLAQSALRHRYLFTPSEYQTALSTIGALFLPLVIEAFSEHLKLELAAGKHRTWEDEIAPFFLRCWPKIKTAHGPGTAVKFADLVLKVAPADFPDAVEVLHRWVSQPARNNIPLHKLQRSGLIAAYPEASLRFLHAMYRDGLDLRFRLQLAAALSSIEEAAPALRETTHFQALLELASSRPA